MRNVYCNCSFNNRCFPTTIVSDANAALDVVRRAKCPIASYGIDDRVDGSVYMHIRKGELSINLEFINCGYKAPVCPFVADIYLIWRWVIRKHMRILGLRLLHIGAIDPIYHDAFVVATGSEIYFNGARIDSYRPYRIYQYEVARVFITGYGDASMSSFVALSMAANGGGLLY